MEENKTTQDGAVAAQSSDEAQKATAVETSKKEDTPQADPAAKKPAEKKDDKRNNFRGRGGRRPGGRGKGRPRREREKPEYEQKIVNIRRVTRVMAGGRRFSFSVVIVIGNKKGVVGVGIGKANDTSLAIQKAYNDAKKNLTRLKLTENFSIPYSVQAKYNSARVMMMPNTARGVIAGSSLRTICELAGMRDVTAKVISRSKNQLNNARALMKALSPFSEKYVPKPKPTSAEAGEKAIKEATASK